MSIKKTFKAKCINQLEAKVNVDIFITDLETGHVIKTIRRHNLVVTVGMNLVRDFLYGDAVSGLSWFAIGTDTTAAAAGNTTLGAETLRKVFTTITKSSAKLTMNIYLDSTEGNGVTLSEAALFGGAASVTPNSGTLFARVKHTAIVKTSSIGISYNWDIQMGV